MHLRQLTHQHLPAWSRLLAEVESADHTGRHLGVADLEEEMAAPDVEVDRDFLGAFDGDELVGVATVLPRGESEGAFKVQVDGAVTPRRRGEGFGTALAEAMLARALETGRARRPDLPLRVAATALSTNRAQADLLERAGLCAGRTSYVMRRSLSGLPVAPALPSGYQIRAYDASMADALRMAHNGAFAGDHPGFTPWTEQVWARRVTEARAFRPTMTRVVVPSGSRAIVGYLITDELDSHAAATGRREAHIGRVGTSREHRGRGIASALLGHCLTLFASAGYDEASLYVDAENPTGALRVYQRAGFEVEHRATAYVLDVPL